MKIPKKVKYNKAIILAVIVLLLVIGATLYYISNRSNQVNNTSDNTHTPLDQVDTQQKQEQAKIDADNKQRYLDQEKTETSDSPDQLPPTNESITLTAKNEDELVVVTTNLDSVSSGTCTLTLTSNGKTLTKTASVIYTPEYSSCAGFSINKSELSGNSWLITLSVNTSTSTITKSITHSL